MKVLKADIAKHYFFAMKTKTGQLTGRYRISKKPFPLYVSEVGDLCTNLKDLRSYEMVSFFHSVQQAQFNFIKAKKVEADFETKTTCGADGAYALSGSTKCVYPANVKNVMKHLPKAEFEKLIVNQKTSGKIKYYDFLQAVASAPAFCNTKNTKFDAELLCKKELAAFFAFAIGFTQPAKAALKSVKDVTKDGTVTKGTPLYLQGFKNDED